MIVTEPAVMFAPANELVGERFGAALAVSQRAVVCYCEPRHETAARAYFERIGREAVYYVCHEPAFGDLERDTGEVLKIIVTSLLDRRLADRCYQHARLQLFADHHYLQRAGRESPELFAIGTTAAGITALAATAPDAALSRDRLADVMRLPTVREIRLHASASIAQACVRYIARTGTSAKTALVTHDDTIDPREYARIARSEVAPGVLPLHAQCAASGVLADLYDERPDEVVFASHHYMALDPLVLARRPGGGPARHPIAIAAQRSPIGLVKRWISSGNAVHRMAASNLEAAEIVARGEAELCITTDAAARQHELATAHRFGAPMMLFTFGAAVTERALHDYASAPVSASAVA